MSPKTFRDQILAPGAAPTTPILLSFAAAIPATMEPWPRPSLHTESGTGKKNTNDTHRNTFKSGCLFTPVSNIAISASTGGPPPSPDFAALKSAPIRFIPVEFFCGGCGGI